ncbi:prepilin-type N-terminal cleavage/methylation domain-containing protein [uncultured Aquitalea sp.]|uniref:type IV pilus modification PilV family protein n=1 Tax=uncultured Aquitalea sp. TaxID=540272 RepID=UPI0025F6B56B|nr:prepilin-type N-terminal cleavage/methylation domain-containing protein [uncultured Aquitalea sp.]
MKCARGFSMVEVLISLVVLAVGVLGLMRFQGYLFHQQILANDYNAATNLAQTALEQRHAGASPAWCDQENFAPPEPNASGTLARFQCRSASKGDQTAVTVRWTTSDGEAAELSLTAPSRLQP